MSSQSNDNPIVLVVDDEPMIRDTAAELLEQLGFETIRASNADHAIHAIEQRPETRILFTDWNMPGAMRGDELAAYVEGRWPAIGLIIATGHGDRSEIKVPDRCVFVSKPYRIQNLSSIIRQMIQGTAALPNSGSAA